MMFQNYIKNSLVLILLISPLIAFAQETPQSCARSVKDCPELHEEMANVAIEKWVESSQRNNSGNYNEFLKIFDGSGLTFKNFSRRDGYAYFLSRTVGKYEFENLYNTKVVDQKKHPMSKKMHKKKILPHVKFLDQLFTINHLLYYYLFPERIVKVEIESSEYEDISTLFPDSVCEIHNKKGKRHANCVNAVLFWHGLETQKYTSPYRVKRIIEESFDLLPEGEVVKKGDVIAIYGPDSHGISLLHTMIYFDNHIAWHKATSNDEDKYSFVELNEIILEYSFAKESKNSYVKIYRKKQIELN